MAEIIKEDFSRQKCGVCHKRFATRYCDYVIQYPKSATFICGRTGYQDFVGADAKVMICDMDDHSFEVTYFGEDGEHIVDVYSYVECDKSDEEDGNGEI